MKRILTVLLVLVCTAGAARADLSIGATFSAATDIFYALKLLPGDEGYPERKADMGSFGNWYLDGTYIEAAGSFAEGRAGAYLSLALDRAGTAILPSTITGWVKPFDFLEFRITNSSLRSINRYRSILDRTGSNWGPLVIARFDRNDPDSPVLLPLGGFGASGTTIQNLSFGTTDAERLSGYIIRFTLPVVGIDLALSNAEIAGAADFRRFAILFGENQKRVGAGARITVPVEGLGSFAAIYRVDYDDDFNTVIRRNVSVPVQGTSGNQNATVTVQQDALRNRVTNRHAFGVYANISAIPDAGIAFGYSGDIGSYDREISTNGTTWAQAAQEVINLHAGEIRTGWYPGNFGLEFMQNFTTGLYGEADRRTYASKTDFGISYNITDMATVYLELSNRFVTFYASDNSTRLMAHDSMYIVPRLYLGITPYAQFYFDIRAQFDLYNMLRVDGLDKNIQKRIQVRMPLTLEITM